MRLDNANKGHRISFVQNRPSSCGFETSMVHRKRVSVPVKNDNATVSLLEDLFRNHYHHQPPHHFNTYPRRFREHMGYPRLSKMEKIPPRSLVAVRREQPKTESLLLPCARRLFQASSALDRSITCLVSSESRAL